MIFLFFFVFELVLLFWSKYASPAHGLSLCLWAKGLSSCPGQSRVVFLYKQKRPDWVSSNQILTVNYDSIFISDVKTKFGNDAIAYAKMNHHMKVAQYMEDKGPQTQALVNKGTTITTTTYTFLLLAIINIIINL